MCVLRTKHKTPNAGDISYLFCWHEQVDGIFLSCVYTRREDVCGRVIAAPFTWTSVSAYALSDRRYIALLCSYTLGALFLHRCILFVFPLSLYHSQRTSSPRVCMSISVGNRIDAIFLFCIETHRSVLFVVTPSSCCPYNVQSERLLQVPACAFLGRASTRMPTVHSSKFCFHIVAVCLWSRRPCHVYRERLPHISVCVCTSWGKLDENADDIYFSSVFIHIVAYYRSVLFVVALSWYCSQPTSTPRVCVFIFWAKQRLQRRSFCMPFSLPTYARTVFHVSLHNQVRGHAIFEVVLTNRQPPAPHNFIHHPREMTPTILSCTI